MNAAPAIGDNLSQVKTAIVNAAEMAARRAEDITLVAVSKTKPADLIELAIAAGQRVYGENRVQEALDKWPDLKVAHPDVALHLIGPLQRNKVKRAVALFDVIETVDRPKLARSLATEMEASGHRPACFIQVNTGEEEQKAGILPGEADDFIRLCRDQLSLPVQGLMCIPPIDEESSLHFALLREIARRNGLKSLSMGMSADYETAVEFGATHVRIGTAIFGEREPFKAAPG